MTTTSATTLQSLIDAGLEHHRAERWTLAEAAYRQVLAEQPDHRDALHLLGVLAHQVGRDDLAEPMIRRAMAAVGFNGPAACAMHGNLALVLLASGRAQEAVDACSRALALDPNYPDAHNVLGNALLAQGRLADAAAAYRRAIALRPDYHEALSNLGNVLCTLSQFPAALEACNRAISLRPDYPEAHNHLGNVMFRTGHLDRAVIAYRQAIALRHNYGEAHFNLGVTLYAQGYVEAALNSYRNAIAARPTDVRGHNNLIHALYTAGRLDETADACRAALALLPDYAEAHNLLANVLRDQGQIEAALPHFRRAVQHHPQSPAALSGLLYALYYHPASTQRTIAEEHQLFELVHARPLRSTAGVVRERHANDRSPERRLRIGYFSPDFRAHAAAVFLQALLPAHDRKQVEIICYSDVATPDVVTAKLRRNADAWHDTRRMSDAQLAQFIERDRVDVLIDLTMHMAGGRPLMFARKPAPVQVAWLAYPGTTGLSSMDYRLSDPHLDPPGAEFDANYVERTLRLPDTFWCYSALAKDVQVNPSPATMSGVVTFGSLNNFSKVNDLTLDLWARVLASVTESRLLLLAAPGSHRDRTRARFAAKGVAPDRIDFADRQPWRQYMELYNRIDAILDTFPYNGHTTSLDALWMGVPVVTIRGQTPVSRAGYCYNANLGLTDLIADNAEDFVRIATELAGNVPKLAYLRSTLRRRMEQSPLMDARRFAGNLEEACRTMWRAWCASDQGSVG